MMRRTHARRRHAARFLVPALATSLVAGVFVAGPAVAAASTAPAATASPNAAPAWKVPRLKVMPLGDSITRGAGSSTGSGYRAELRSRLAAHADNLQFVGSVQTNGQNHEGHSGWMIDDLSDNIEHWLADAKPNVVLLDIGTNDIDRDFHADEAPARLTDLVDRITTAAPDVTLLVSSLVPNGTKDDPSRQQRVERYNKFVPQLVEERRKKGLHVGYVDMGAVTKDDLVDNLHPNDAGYVKMAEAFYGGIARAAADGWVRESVDVKPAPPVSAPLGDSTVDINGDGKADYLVVEDDGLVRAWLNNGGDTGNGWKSLGQFAGGVMASGSKVRFADIDGDGRADYLILEKDGSVRAWLNNGGDSGNGWKKYGQFAGGTGAPGSKVRFADINGDGKADYLVVDDNGAVRAWINNGGDQGNGWTSYGQIATGVGMPGSKVRFADIDGDRRADYLAVDDNGGVRAWANDGGDGHGGWINYGRVATGTGDSGDLVRFADVNGDGKADYLMVDADGAVRAWINNGGDKGNGWIKWGQIATGTGRSSGGKVRI
ncbi:MULTISPECIES: FG-GAP-like repeat-containing protein [Streptomyces]|uniref:FG-GAP-like repeat-containing protein n=1 Tax=Streptomyces luteosporeus TaxID=173856 RepID=A0ABN3U165_9ACTN